MPKREPVVHRVDLNDVQSNMRDPRLVGLFNDGWTVAANWIQRDGLGEALMLMMVPPNDIRTILWQVYLSVALVGIIVSLITIGVAGFFGWV